jgi:hypothetical protein
MNNRRTAQVGWRVVRARDDDDVTALIALASCRRSGHGRIRRVVRECLITAGIDDRQKLRVPLVGGSKV